MTITEALVDFAYRNFCSANAKVFFFFKEELVKEQINANCMESNKSVCLTTHSKFGKETDLHLPHS